MRSLHLLVLGVWIFTGALAQANCRDVAAQLAISDPKPGNFVFIGAPGAGKSTQGKLVAQKLGIPHISIGELLRAEVAAQTPLGKLVAPYMEKGSIVPDDSPAMALLMERLSARLAEPDAKKGFVLDGLRSDKQAVWLSEMMAHMGRKVDAVISLDVEADEVRRRLAGRGRNDDKPEVIEQRLRAHHQAFAPVVDYYREAKLLHEVKSEGEAEDVLAKVLRALPH